ncbi:MAG: type II toxin-antitoxin system RelE/ParE family toxin [Desulfamplus sp.]|nr:type II toxin-antitoxin system RelE/ParE family toxin [Desulfamplus sp.]
MSYTIFLKHSAEKELEHLNVKTHDRIVAHLIALKENPLPSGVKKLQGRIGYRIRVGGYRILYEINETEKQIEIFAVAHRKEAYR